MSEIKVGDKVRVRSNNISTGFNTGINIGDSIGIVYANHFAGGEVCVVTAVKRKSYETCISVSLNGFVYTFADRMLEKLENL